jgi:hypothetical protein
MSEDVWPFISSISDNKKRQFEIEENAHLGDRELFTNINEQSFVFITAENVKPDFFEYFKEISGISDIEVLVPSNNSGQICEDILNDKKILDRLVQLGKKIPLNFKSYSSSYSLYKLINKLQKKNIKVSASESPAQEHAWTVNYFGSKTGIRQLIAKMNNKNIQMAEGLITNGIDNAAEIATHWYFKHKGVVIKTHKGHAGAGVLLFKNGTLPEDYEECKAKILKTLEKDEYWKLFPVIIETYIDFDETVSGGFPNIEYQIQADGTVKALYPCGMRIDKGVFMGVEIHESIYDKKLTEEIIKIGDAIGKEYSKQGYRGNFEVDFALGKNGKLYITESNVRKTGGTYVYETAKKLIGKNFLKESYILSTNVYKLPLKKKYSFSSLSKTLDELHFSTGTKEGIVITSANLLQHGSFGYIIFGRDKKRALDIERKMIGILNN